MALNERSKVEPKHLTVGVTPGSGDAAISLWGEYSDDLSHPVIGRQTGRQAGRQASRHTDGRTDGRTDR